MIDLESVELSCSGTKLSAFVESRLETPEGIHGKELSESQRIITVMR